MIYFDRRLALGQSRVLVEDPLRDANPGVVSCVSQITSGGHVLVILRRALVFPKERLAEWTCCPVRISQW